MNHVKRYWILVAVVLVALAAGYAGRALQSPSVEPASRAIPSPSVEPASREFQSPSVGQATPWTDRPVNNDPSDFHFAIVSDRNGGHRPGVFAKAMRQINLMQPEFVMCVGDLVDGGTADHAALKQQYDEMDAIVGSLQMPFCRVTGNHDIGNEVMADVYRDRYGSPYYHFVYKDVLFLVVCTEDPPTANISDAQVSYMHKALRDNKSVRWTFVFMHQPLFLEKDGKLHEAWGKIEATLASRAHTVFAGHWHGYTKQQKHGRNYYRLATTGGASGLEGVEAGYFDHIMWVTMTSEGPRIANLMMDGIYDDELTVAEQPSKPEHQAEPGTDAP